MQELADTEAAATGKPKAAKKDAGGSKTKAAKPAQVPKEQKAASDEKTAGVKRKDLTVGCISVPHGLEVLSRPLFPHTSPL